MSADVNNNLLADIGTILDSILGATVTPGKLKSVPFNVKTGTTFYYGGEEITLSAVYANKASQVYFVDMTWDSGNQAVYGIALKSGVNLMEQYQYAPLTNLYAFDEKNIGRDPLNWHNLVLYFIDPAVD